MSDITTAAIWRCKMLFVLLLLSSPVEERLAVSGFVDQLNRTDKRHAPFMSAVVY